MLDKIQKISLASSIIALALLRQILPFTVKESKPLRVNVLTNGLKISDTTKTDILELDFPHSYGKI